MGAPPSMQRSFSAGGGRTVSHGFRLSSSPAIVRFTGALLPAGGKQKVESSRVSTSEVSLELVLHAATVAVVRPGSRLILPLHTPRYNKVGAVPCCTDETTDSAQRYPGYATRGEA
eukprot:7078499-Prymnesium_polylepis.1